MIFQNMLSYYENFEYRNHSITLYHSDIYFFITRLKEKGAVQLNRKNVKIDNSDISKYSAYLHYFSIKLGFRQGCLFII